MNAPKCARCGDTESFEDACCGCGRILFAPFVCGPDGNHYHEGCGPVPAPKEPTCKWHEYPCDRPQDSTSTKGLCVWHHLEAYQRWLMDRTGLSSQEASDFIRGGQRT
jgi:hypothetical protein